MTNQVADASPPRIDSDKLLELCRKRHVEGQVTLSWAMMLQIIDQLREASASENPIAPVPPVVTDGMVEAAAEAHMPFGEMRAAVEAALAEAPAQHNEAIAAAEALEEAASETVPQMHKMAEWLRMRARLIRRHGAQVKL